ncbi:class F sortase [Planococcus lenghuensis]|uniref:Class F sortase n=1 Tax=Planococcus lenghuensis TaxID=2213202 RepID=A0A1Q2L5D2_9BACL|nr:class F sortase [Planococcus lenghuensis]AQQ55626.1 hypothetical protein B0X71_20845 [Planococcus lenghuensis]
MNGLAKKLFLIYSLFLLTTISDNPNLTPAHFSAENEAVVELNEPQANTVLPEAQQPAETRVEVPGVTANTPEPAVEVAGITPVAIELPAIGEKAEVIEVGQTEEGAMEAPSNIYQIGWYAPGTKPGSSGNAVMAGHVDGLTSPGTFYNLKKLEPGDEIHITGTSGMKLTFVVTDKKSYVPEEAPLEEIFGPSSESRLNLITCTGVFNDDTGLYEERLVVYTELVGVSEE